jgi:RNA polymerase sigma-70 factor (ECF subfamily)
MASYPREAQGVNLAHDDLALVRSLLRGDEEAYAEFFDEYFSRLYRFALARLHDETDAEEVVQSTLIRAMRKLAGYRGEARLFTWLCTICRHEIADLAKRRSRRSLAVDLVEENPEVRAALESLPASLDTEPERRLHLRELGRLVQVTLDHLPRHYGNALEWKYLEGLSVAEIAERLGIGPKAAESLLTRARQTFRSDFAAIGGSFLERALSPEGVDR